MKFNIGRLSTNFSKGDKSKRGLGEGEWVRFLPSTTIFLTRCTNWVVHFLQILPQTVSSIYQNTTRTLINSGFSHDHCVYLADEIVKNLMLTIVLPLSLAFSFIVTVCLIFRPCCQTKPREGEKVQ